MSKQYQEEDASYYDEPLVYEMIKDLVEYDLEHMVVNELMELATDQLYSVYWDMKYENLKKRYNELFNR